MLKQHAVGVAVASAVDLFVGDPMSARLSPMLQGPAKMVGYPILGALGHKFVPSMSKIWDGIALFGFAFGVKDTLARVLGTPQAAMKDLADAYGDQMGALVSNTSGMRALVDNSGMRGFGDGVTNEDYVDVD